MNQNIIVNEGSLQILDNCKNNCENVMSIISTLELKQLPPKADHSNDKIEKPVKGPLETFSGKILRQVVPVMTPIPTLSINARGSIWPTMTFTAKFYSVQVNTFCMSYPLTLTFKPSADSIFAWKKFITTIKNANKTVYNMWMIFAKKMKWVSINVRRPSDLKSYFFLFLLFY